MTWTFLRHVLLSTTCWALTGLATPTFASSGLWGLGDGLGLPDATALPALTCELGLRVAALQAWRQAGEEGRTFGLGYGRIGAWPGVDLGLTYGWPGQSWPLPGIRWQLVDALPGQPWNLAVGWIATAVTGDLQQTGYLVASRTFGPVSLSGGCSFDPSLQTRVLGTLTWRDGALGEFGVAGEGPRIGDLAPRLAAGVELEGGRPWRGLMAVRDVPEGTQVVAGGGIRFRLTQTPAAPDPRPTPEATASLPPRATPAPGATTTGRVQAPRLPRASVIVRVVDPDHRPLAGMRVELTGHDRPGTSNVLGYALCPNVPAGTWNIVVRDSRGNSLGQHTLVLRDTEPVMLTIPVERPGDIP